MSGIFGVINRNDEIIDEALLNKVINTVKYEKWDNVDWIRNNNIIGISEINNIKCINLNKENNVIGVSKGQILNKEELSKKFNVNYHNTYLNDVNFILKLYEKRKTNFIKYLNGIFNIGLYDINNDEIFVINDKYGFYPLFYAITKNRFAFSSQIKTLFAGTDLIPEIEESAIPEFISFKHPLGHKTFFKNIYRLPPASILFYDGSKNKLKINQYYDFLNINRKTDNFINITDAVRIYEKLMLKSIKRNLQDKDKIGIFLSGGLDSTILAGFTSRMNVDLITFSFGHKNCYLEREVPKRISEELGIENTYYEISSDFITNFSDKIVDRGNGLIRIRESHFISCLKKVREKVDTIFMGTFGGIFKDRRYRFLLSLFKSRLKGQKRIKDCFLDDRSKYFPLSKYSNAFNDQFYPTAIKLTIQDFNKDYKNIIKLKNLQTLNLHATPRDDLIRNWSLKISFPNGIAQTFQYINWYLETRHPYLDTDLVNFAFSLPLIVLQENRFLKKAINYCFPNLTKIELERGAKLNANPLGVELGRFKKYMRGGKYMNFFRGKKNTNIFDYRDYCNWIKTGSKEYVVSVINNSEFIKKYFAENYIKNIINNHMNNTDDNNEIICDLLNIALIHKIFLKK